MQATSLGVGRGRWAQRWCRARSRGVARPRANACAGSRRASAARCSTRATPRSPRPDPRSQVVLHFLDPDAARPYRRKAAPTFVVALAELPEAPVDLLRTGYPLLVRGLANLCVMVSRGPTARSRHFVTLEQGTYTRATPRGDDDDFFKRGVRAARAARDVAARDRATSSVPDLARELWEGDEHTAQIARAGERARRARPPAGGVPDRGDPLATATFAT